jgi:hypothetical protein
MEVVEMAMKIFIMEYTLLAVTLLIVGCSLTKKPKSNYRTAKLSANDGKSKQLHWVEKNETILL